MSNQRGIIGLEEGMGILEGGFAKAMVILEGSSETRFTADDYMKYYECVYRMCTQHPMYARQLYDRYKLALEQCVTSVVLPSLRDKSNDVLLQELLRLWTNYQTVVRWLSNFFHYIDRFYTQRTSLPPLHEVALNSFRNLVYPPFTSKIRDSVVNLIAQERSGKQVDVDLLKSVINIILEVDDDTKDLFEAELEKAILEDTCLFYSQKVPEWLFQSYVPDYESQVDACLKKEGERLSWHLICRNEARRSTMLQTIKEHVMNACKIQLENRGPCSDFPLRSYLTINQELSTRCAALSLGDGKSSSVSCMDMDL